MRRQGVDAAWDALEEMHNEGKTTDKYTVSRMLMKTVGEGGSRLDPSRAYRGISLVERFIEMQPEAVDEVLFNALLDTCCRLKDLYRLESCVQWMKELQVKPSPITLGILVKTYGQAGDLQKVLAVWDEMEEQRGMANSVTYGCMLDACVKCGNLEKATEVFQGMRESGKHRNTILYTTMIKGFGLEKDLARALDLFYEMPNEGVPYNTITYNSILEACVKCGDVLTAECLLQQMLQSDSDVEPDLISFSTLLKGYCQSGDIDKALGVCQNIKERGLHCDELVYNTLMDGCVKANDITSGIGLFEEMVQLGLKPSAITSSILARLYQRAGYDENYNDKVTELYQQYGVERPIGGDRPRGGRTAYGRPRRSPGGSPAASVISDSGSVGGWGNVPSMPGGTPGSASPSLNFYGNGAADAFGYNHLGESPFNGAMYTPNSAADVSPFGTVFDSPNPFGLAGPAIPMQNGLVAVAVIPGMGMGPQAVPQLQQNLQFQQIQQPQMQGAPVQQLQIQQVQMQPNLQQGNMQQPNLQQGNMQQPNLQQPQQQQQQQQQQMVFCRQDQNQQLVILS